MAKKRKAIDPEQEKLMDTFADVFHSVKDLHKISPDDFLKKLARKGVTLAAVSTAPIPPSQRETP